MVIPYFGEYYLTQEVYNDRGGQMTFGFLGTAQGTSPWGFLSWGFLWACGDIWYDGQGHPVTVWSGGSTLVTSWTGPTGNPWAEC